MSIFFMKSLLSMVMILSAGISLFTMFEIYGRSKLKFSADRMKKIHRITGVFYLLVFAFVAYFCFSFIVMTGAELTPRGTFHSIFALTILLLLGLKVTYIRVYRQFYNQTKMIGLLIALLTFGMTGISGGYYLLVSDFGTDTSFDKIQQYKMRTVMAGSKTADESLKIEVRKDPESIGRGKNIFDSKCSFCHNAYSTETTVGPGLKGILKNPKLPVSRRPAAPENIIRQLRKPINMMPSFEYLSDEEIADLIAFLNTL